MARLFCNPQQVLTSEGQTCSLGTAFTTSIGLDSELLLQEICERRHILDRQADLAHMEHRSCSKGSFCLVVQTIMHNIFQDIACGVTKVE